MQAFKLAKETAAADMAKSSRATVSAADAAEVARVLAARDDYAVLRVQPGASSAALRKRYREMAVSLHPDKCRVIQRSRHSVPLIYCVFFMCLALSLILCSQTWACFLKMVIKTPAALMLQGCVFMGKAHACMPACVAFGMCMTAE